MTGIFNFLRNASGAVALWLAAAGVAHATLVNSSITATLNSPDNGGTQYTGTKTVLTPAAEFTTLNDAGAVLGTNGVGVREEINVEALSISLVLIDGLGNGDTGWGAGANWVFSGLDFGAETLSSASITSYSGISNFSAGWLTVDSPTQVTLDIGSMLLTGARTADRVGRLTITFTTQSGGGGGGGTVPEPATLALVSLGLLAAIRLRRVA